jgi:hypothetical protein
MTKANAIRKLTLAFLVLTLLMGAGGTSWAQRPPKGYAERQTYAGRAYFKDNSVWAYSKEFGRLFGMPESDSAQIEGAEAAVFRIEDAPYSDCGLAGDPNYCAKVHLCYLEIYFDESRVALPWATDRRMEYVDVYGSLRWLEPVTGSGFQRDPTTAEVPPNVIKNRALFERIVAFADPATRRSAIFLTNASSTGSSPSSSLALLGFTRNFYQDLSLVKLHYPCTQTARDAVDVWLAAPLNVLDPSPRLLSVSLRQPFVRAMNDKLEVEAAQTRQLLERLKRR